MFVKHLQTLGLVLGYIIEQSTAEYVFVELKFFVNSKVVL